MTDTPATPDTPGWLEKLDVRDLGALTATVQRVQAVVGNKKSSTGDLTRVLQNDPTLVSNVLRISNSPTYMVTSEPVTTITRASNLIGFDAIRNICITNRLLDALLEERGLSRDVTERLLRRLASSLHAAIQARMLMRGASVRDREEAFLGALLERIGESAFWSTGGEEVEALATALGEPGADAEKVVRKHLGSGFRELSRELIRSWGLEEALAGDPSSAARAGPSHALVVQLANEIADIAAQEGWQSPRMKALLERIASLLEISTEEALLRLRACAKEAEHLASCYGANLLAKRMVHKPPAPEPARRKPAPEQAAQNAASTAALGGDSAVQLRVLRQMSALAGDKGDINAVIRAAMDGVHAGIGMERTLTALLTPDRKELQLRFWLGDGGEDWSKGFRFEVGRGHNLLHDCVEELKSERYDSRAPGAIASRVPAPLMRFCAGQDFLLAPVAVGVRGIGVIYADRAPGGAPINEQEYAAFRHFSQQLGACLAEISRRRS